MAKVDSVTFYFKNNKITNHKGSEASSDNLSLSFKSYIGSLNHETRLSK